MPNAVPPPKVDELDVRESDVSPQSWNDLVAGVMEARDCSRPDAERHVNDIGLEQAERELRARWLGSDGYRKSEAGE